MKSFEIRVNGQAYTVEIDDPNSSPVQVVVNGQPFEVTIVPTRAPASKQAAQGAVPAGPSDDLLLDTYVPTMASTYIEVAPEPEPARDRQPVVQTPREGGEAVVAPMPGTVLDIVVKVGDVVQQGDTLCNLEAMKMKSPIRSPGQGTVQQILISEGQNVAFGDVLFTLG